MNLLFSIWKYAGVEKEFLVSLSILFVLSGIFIVLIKAYISFREKQKECDGRFKLNELEIKTVKEDIKDVKTETKEALEIVRRVEKCSDKMQSTVDEIREGYKDFIEDKWGKVNAKEEAG